MPALVVALILVTVGILAVIRLSRTSRQDVVDFWSLWTGGRTGEHRLWRDFFSMLPQPCMITDNEGRVQAMNHPMGAVLGLSQLPAKGIEVHDICSDIPMLQLAAHGDVEQHALLRVQDRLFHIHLAPMEEEQLRMVLLEDVSLQVEAEADLQKTRDELEQRVEERTQAYLEANLSLQKEISERKRVEGALAMERDRAEEMSRVKSLFLANMSHEIRTPLTGILGFTQILAMEVQEHLRHFVQAIDHSGRRLLDTLTAVLELSRLEAGQVELNPTPCDLTEELQLIMELFQRRAQQKGLALIWEVSYPALPVVIDRGALNCVLQNLLSNAIKFTREGEVRLLVNVEGRNLKLAVQDTGIGISEAFLPHLFDRFRRESEGIGAVYEGSGLGLSLVDHFVKLMGGELSVTSHKPGGTTFTVWLKDVLEEELETQPVASVPTVVPRSSEGIRVLVVEDNLTTQAFIRYLIEDRYTFDMATNSDEAHTCWDQNMYDVVLMDINLGEADRDGIMLMQAFREDPRGANLPIVALTAYALPGDRERFLELGFDAYLSKPFDADQLYDLLGSFMQSRPGRGPVPPGESLQPANRGLPHAN